MCNIPSHNELSKCGGGRLYGRSNKHYQGPDENRTPTTQFITVADDEERANKTAYLVDRNDQSLDRAQLIVARHLWECTKKDGFGDDSTHHALVYALD